MPALDSDSVTLTPTLDPYEFTAQTGRVRRGSVFRISPYIKINGTTMDSLGALVSITMKLTPKENPLSVLVQKTDSAPHLQNSGLSGVGPGCCDFDFTSSDSNLDLTGGDGKTKVFSIFYSATLTSSRVIPLGTMDLTVYEDPSAVALAVIGSNAQNARITTANKFQLKDPDTGLWHDIFIDGGQIAIGTGGS